MNDQTKPGWKTTEWWTTMLTQIVAVCVMVGIVSVQDGGQLTDSLAKCVGAAFVFWVNAQVVLKYIVGRFRLKMQDEPAETGTTPTPAIAIVCLLALAATAPAQQVSTFVPAPDPTPVMSPLLPVAQAEQAPPHGGLQIGLFNFGNGACFRRRQQQSSPGDSEIKAILQRMADQQQQLLSLLQQRQSAPTPTPAPASPQPIVYLLPQQYQLPISGQPRQELPIQGQPRQELPVPGQPRQELPTPGAPRQELPGPGAPRLELPIRPPTPMPPAPPEPAPAAPTPRTTSPVGPPQGYQRFTSYALVPPPRR